MNHGLNAASELRDDQGLLIHRITTEVGPLFITLEGEKNGQVWTDAPLVVNRIPHALEHARFVIRQRYGYVEGRWQETSVPFASLDGYPGLRRADGGGAPTEKARHKIEDAIGHAIAKFIASEDRREEGRINARELAAQEWDRKARYAHDRATRELTDAGTYTAEAARIRAGAAYA